MKNVCFTGHRKLNDSYELKIKLLDKFKSLIENGAVNFYCGGAVGWDALCAEAVIAMKKIYPHITLNLVLPCSNNEHILKWSAVQKNIFFTILNAADNIEYTSEHYFRNCMKIRNERLVELADCCVCYYNPLQSASGTGQTLRMAEKKGIPVYNLFE